MPEIAATALGGQFIYSLVIFALVQLLAPWVASLLGDRELTPLIRIASIDIPVYAAYFCYLGVLNGRGTFSRQAASVTVYSGSKLVVVVALVALGVGVKGAFLGNAVASILGLAVARFLVGPIRTKKRFPIRKMVGYVAGTALLAVVFTFLISMDLFMVEALVHDREQVGIYTAAAMLAKAPFFLFLAIANVTLPSVSRALSSGSPELAKTYVAQSFRLHLMLLMPLTSIVSASSRGVVSLIYRSAYGEAALALSMLIVAFMFWGLLNGVFNLMLAKRQTLFPVLTTLILIASMAVTSRYAVVTWGISGAAGSAALIGLAGLLVAGLVAYRQFGALVPPMSLARIAVASSMAYLCARMINVGGIAVILGMFTAFVVYTLVLCMSGEITTKDFSRLFRMGMS